MKTLLSIPPPQTSQDTPLPQDQSQQLSPVPLTPKILLKIAAENSGDPGDIQFKDSRGFKTGAYPKARILAVIQAAKKVGVDPHQALALALQETGFGTYKIHTTAATQGRRNRAGWGTVGDVGFDANDEEAMAQLTGQGMDATAVRLAYALKKKLAYAKALGFKDEAAQLQAYNGYGKLTKNSFGSNKAYGVDIGGGINLRDNPLYGKRLIELKNDLKNNKDIQALMN